MKHSEKWCLLAIALGAMFAFSCAGNADGASSGVSVGVELQPSHGEGGAIDGSGGACAAMDQAGCAPIDSGGACNDPADCPAPRVTASLPSATDICPDPGKGGVTVGGTFYPPPLCATRSCGSACDPCEDFLAVGLMCPAEKQADKAEHHRCDFRHECLATSD